MIIVNNERDKGQAQPVFVQIPLRNKIHRVNKIVAAFDGLKYSADTAQYAIELARQTGSFLTGVFLDDFTYSSFRIYELIQKNELGEKDIQHYRDRDQQTRDAAAQHFEKACRAASIQHTIHRDKKICLPELLHESVYADLLIIDQKETFTHYEEKLPTRFIRDLLADVQCPVLLVNQSWTPIEKLVFLYDGAPSSVNAVKSFNYLFPLLAAEPALVLSSKGYYGDLHLPDNKLMKEFMKRHYPKAAYEVLKGQPEEEIISRVKKETKGSLIIIGANRRGLVSRWFKKSMADLLMEASLGPIFIAHSN